MIICIHASLFILKIEEVADIIQFHQQQYTKKQARAYVLLTKADKTDK
jgi:hypothetical protein